MKSTFKLIIGIIVFLLATVHLVAITLFICPASKLLAAAGYDVEYVDLSNIPTHLLQVFPDDNVVLYETDNYFKMIPRKILSLRYDKFFNESERQELYLNTLNFGEDIIGIESASNYYFNKPVSDLGFEEALTLSGIYKVFMQ